jgi:hypothetical protein
MRAVSQSLSPGGENDSRTYWYGDEPADRRHVTRAANPDDRRSIFVQATEKAHAEVRQTLGNMHDRMLAAVIEMSAEESEVVVNFLHRMSDAVDGVAVDAGSPSSP